MPNERIGHGANRREIRHAPWWAASPQRVGLASVLILLAGKILSNLITWGITRLVGYTYITYQSVANNPMLKVSTFLKHWRNQPFTWKTVLQLGLPTGGWLAVVVLVITLTVSILVITRFWLVYQSYNTLEHGAETFATRHEIKSAYHLVPDRVKFFSGTGGVPVSHFNGGAGYLLQWMLAHKWVPGSRQLAKSIQNGLFPTGRFAIDTDTNNTLGIGITRSGKGETFVLPTIDLLSRAEEKSSMIVNDPKRELVTLSQAMLRDRGYRVMVLDLDRMANSMGYNPLTIIVNYAKKQNWAKVQMETNRLSTAIYAKENSRGDNAFWDNSSINLLNALILAQIDLARRQNSWEKVSLHNVYEMMTNLGGQTVPNTDSDGKVNGTISALTAYFQGLRELNEFSDDDSQEIRRLALDAFAQSKFAGEETAGSIYASMMEGIKIYQQRDLAQLTAQSSFDIREAGFPRWLTVRLPKSMKNQPISVSFWETNRSGNRIKLLEKRRQQIDEVGWLEYPIKHELPERFEIQLQLPTEIAVKPIILTGYKHIGLKGLPSVQLQKVSGLVKQAQVHYSNRPIALFLVTPPDNPSYNQIVSFFVDQSFNQLFGMATASGGKTFTRVHYLLDEFGNLPKIAHMDTKVSIGLGQNILFSLIVQNLSQLRINYTDEQAQTIESNCANTIYILTKELKTAETISKSLGQTTINSYQHHGKGFFAATQEDFGNSSNSGEALMTATELMHLQMGENVVLRTKRNSKRGADIRNNAIFNRGAMKMPQRWQFLGQTFKDLPGVLQPLTAGPMKINLKSRGYDYLAELRQLTGAEDESEFEENESHNSQTDSGRVLQMTQKEWLSLDDQETHNSLKKVIQNMSRLNVPESIREAVTAALKKDIHAGRAVLFHYWRELQKYRL